LQEPTVGNRRGSRPETTAICGSRRTARLTGAWSTQCSR